MIKNILPRRLVEVTEYTREFTNEDGGGYVFKANAKGEVIFENECQKRNYIYAMCHPEEFPVQYNEFVTTKRTYTEPAVGICRCGKEVALIDEYMGACQCKNCGKWYNIFGQELIDPEYWED
jgi:hypothetical protein